MTILSENQSKNEEKIIVIGIVGMTVECEECGGLTALSGKNIVYNFCGCHSDIPIKIPKVEGRISTALESALTDLAEFPDKYLYWEDEPLTENEHMRLYDLCNMMKEQFLKK